MSEGLYINDTEGEKECSYRLFPTDLPLSGWGRAKRNLSVLAQLPLGIATPYNDILEVLG